MKVVSYAVASKWLVAAVALILLVAAIASKW